MGSWWRHSNLCPAFPKTLKHGWEGRTCSSGSGPVNIQIPTSQQQEDQGLGSSLSPSHCVISGTLAPLRQCPGLQHGLVNLPQEDPREDAERT